MEQPSILVKILHSIPHVNYTFRRVNDTFNPDSDVYLEVSTVAPITYTHITVMLMHVVLGSRGGSHLQSGALNESCVGCFTSENSSEFPT